MKTITINGVAIEATKEDLEKALKEFDKPVWTIEYEALGVCYYLCKNSKRTIVIWSGELSFQENYSQLIYKIANAMGVLASKEDILKLTTKYIIYFNKPLKAFDLSKFNSPVGAVVNNEKNAMLIVNFLNNSPLLKEFE